MVAALSIACGGNNAEKKSDDAKSTETEVNNSESKSKKKKSKKEKTVEDIASEAFEECLEAIYDGDIELVTEIREEFTEWYKGLSRKEQKKIDKILAEYEEDFEEAEANSIPLIADNYIRKVIDALEYGDMDYADEISAEMNEWYESLSKKEQRMADKVIEDYADELVEAAVAAADDCDDEWTDAATGATETPAKLKLTVEQQAKDYLKQMEELTKQYEAALEADDEKKLMELEKKAVKLEKEMVEWYESLSEEDQMIADKVVASYEEKMAEAEKAYDEACAEFEEACADACAEACAEFEEACAECL